VRLRVKGASEDARGVGRQRRRADARERRAKAARCRQAIDWLAALSLLGVEQLDVAAIENSLGSVLKYGEDQELNQGCRPRAARARR